ncbi:MAG: hypothetical protein TH68_00090 [Candidatus Synechococcus spongiarum 142]|uniref:Uncharacterized protein n=1 Tax=Candidatus Synechococcus spongiarum 142 TaxID=1608213 RepID=A0A6N3X742_9SYNE|nr:MAG: hypothetical protein TH68_00090 [Candidatus Synechococcus spongiarum 142]
MISINTFKQIIFAVLTLFRGIPEWAIGEPTHDCSTFILISQLIACLLHWKSLPGTGVAKVAIAVHFSIKMPRNSPHFHQPLKGLMK